MPKRKPVAGSVTIPVKCTSLGCSMAKRDAIIFLHEYALIPVFKCLACNFPLEMSPIERAAYHDFVVAAIDDEKAEAALAGKAFLSANS